MAEVSETVEAVQKIGAELAVKYDKLEGMVKENASAQAVKDLGTQIENAEKKYDDLAERVKGYEAEFEKLTTKLNRDAGLLGRNSETARENFTKAIHEALLQGVKDGKIGENATGNQIFHVKDGHVALHRKAVGTITTGNLTDGSGGQAFSDREISQRVVTEPNPRVRVRSLLNSATMSAALLEYPQFTGGEGSPDYQTSEGAKKAQGDYDWVMKPIQPKTIAFTTDVSKQSLADIGWLSGFISNQMLQDLLTKEDAELLTGAGGASAVHGLVPQATAFVAADADVVSYFDVLIDAIAQLEEAKYDATGVALHPRDVSKLLRYKSTTAEYNHPVLAYNGGLSIEGVPIYKLSQIAKGTGLVADWSKADLLVREGISFNVSHDNKDNFEKNLVTLRIEERIALALYNPLAFVSFDFGSFTYAS